MSEDNGGPAFPIPSTSEYAWNKHGGMSLRDWLAGQALTGILASYAHPQSTGCIPVDKNSSLFMALNAYKIADAMLEARKSL